MISIINLTGLVDFIIEDDTGKLQLIQGTKEEVLKEYHNEATWVQDAFASIHFALDQGMVFTNQLSYGGLRDLIRDLEG